MAPAQLLHSIADTLACLGPGIASQPLLAKVSIQDRCAKAPFTQLAQFISTSFAAITGSRTLSGRHCAG